MKQQSSEATGFEEYQTQNRKEKFIGEMEQMPPWKELCHESSYWCGQ